MTNIDRAVRLIKLYGTRTGSPRDVALELAAAGLLVPPARVIRTMEDLKALDPDTALTLYPWEGATIWKASYFQKRFEDTGYIPPDLPAVVIATGEQVRAALEALEEEK